MSRPSFTETREAIEAAAKKEHAERRELVFKYPDLVARLGRLPWAFSRPEIWTGYIPPLMVEGPHDPKTPRGAWIRNTSPQRIHLVAIVREAYARTWGEDTARAWLEEINTNRWTNDWSPHDALGRAAKVLDRHTPDWAKERS